MSTTDPFEQDHFTVRTKVFKFLGAAFHVYDAAENVVLYSKMKAFKLKEDIRLYRSEDMKEELLVITARSVIDFGATYDVVDPTVRRGPATGLLEYASKQEGGQRIGALRRKGMKSMLRDEWEILDPDDQVVGIIREDSMALAVIRRFVEAASWFLPQKYDATVGGEQAATYKQNVNPFVKKLMVEFVPDGDLDHRLGLAAAVLLLAIEGRQG